MQHIVTVLGHEDAICVIVCAQGGLNKFSSSSNGAVMHER